MSTPTKAGRTAFFTSVVVAIVAATALAVLALALPESRTATLFEETGPFEQASPWLWLAFALWVPLVFRKPTRTVAAGMIVAFAAAAREWDWHVAFTEYSMLKPPFYYREGTVLERIIAGGILVLILASVVILIARLVQLKPWKRPIAWWAYALGFAFCMLVFTKAVDRAPAILQENFGIAVGDRLRLVAYAIEEGLEMVLPFFFAAFTVALARWHAAHRPKGESQQT